MEVGDALPRSENFPNGDRASEQKMKDYLAKFPASSDLARHPDTRQPAIASESHSTKKAIARPIKPKCTLCTIVRGVHLKPGDRLLPNCELLVRLILD